MALSRTSPPPKIPMAGSDARVICDWVDLPAIGVGRIVGDMPANLPFFDLDYLQDAIVQAELMGASYVALSLSAPHKTNGSRCLILSPPASDRAVVLAGFTPDDVEETREAAALAAEDQEVDA